MVRITARQLKVIEVKLRDGGSSLRQIARDAGCSVHAVVRIRHINVFGKSKRPPESDGRCLLVTTEMRHALCEFLSLRPDRYLEEMKSFLYSRFGVAVSHSTLSRVLKAIHWSKKVIRRTAKEQDPDLRDFYKSKISRFQSWQLVFVDESGCDQRTGQRKKGWSPMGITPVQVENFHRGKRYQVLPAYTQDGVLLSQVYDGSTDSVVFAEFIRQLLPLCGRWPEPRSVLIMDNASIHHSIYVKQMCAEAGVILIYLPPYSPDLNPIEEFFAELKIFMRQNWGVYESYPEQGFATFLKVSVDAVGSRRRSARGHFRANGASRLSS